MRSPKRPLRIGFFCPFGDSYHRAVLAGVRNYCESRGDAELVRFRGSYLLTKGALDYVTPDGVVGTSPSGPVRSRRGHVPFPTVNVSHPVRRVQRPSVIHDSLAVGGMAADFLGEQPVRSWSCVAFERPWHGLERCVGFRRRLRQQGRSCVARVIRYPKVDSERRYREYFDELHRQFVGFFEALTLPAAVFCAAGPTANWLIDAALTEGLRIPKDLAILACDPHDDDRADAVMGLSAVVLAAERVGWVAAQTLVEQLRGGRVPALQRIPPARIQESASTGAGPVSAKVAAAVKVLETECRLPLSMSELARRVGASRRSLEVAFRRELGRSPYDYLIARRMARARDLLAGTDHSVEWVAEESGFGDAAALATYFRRNLDLSPRLWRQMHRVR
jgi:LacI family transcriptional regulator